MRLTITNEADQIVSVDLDPSDPIATLKAVLEAETGLAADQQILVHNGRPLGGSGTLASLGLQPDDLIMMHHRSAVQQAAATSGPSAPAAPANPTAMLPDGSVANPAALMEMLRGQQDNLPPGLRAAVQAGDLAKMQEELRGLRAATLHAQEEERRFQRMAAEDPFNPEIQRRMLEAIEQKNVSENYENALEYNPEAFASVCMLYVKMEISGFPINAFIDSGAQMTIMSRSCAERHNLLRLMDKRWQGTAVGVGSAKILGRIHMAQARVGSNFFPLSITVLDQEGMDFLFGLDNLKRHHCCIDLKANLLRFGSTGDALPFLAEHEIPVKERHLQPEHEAEAQPSGGGGGSTAPSSSGAAAHVPPAAPQPAAATTPPPAPAAAAGGGGGLPAGWEEKVAELTRLGFSPEESLQALRIANGDVDVAAGMLF
ncbi:hypothetical protein D9Q98_003763 [Chlorella vulgaris]|uniref:DNA damage-inducible protein 1 n=1 Tax=Chlorella vulgaris TaxID=3077 RepID=A0A9D4TTI4_CHLVU|nr:hypothetical protein D9Q98_003763 [Chlorella vulgaris]